MIRDVVKRSDLSRSRAARDRHIRSGDETAGGDGNCLHPFAAHLNPWLADLLGRVGMNKRFLCGRGCYLVDSEGHTYLDAIAAYGALPFGYNPRRIWKAILEVRRSGEPSFAQPSLLDAGGELAARLTALAPGGMQFVTLTNSGAESAEVMIKLCRARTGRRGVLSAHSGFHGKTLAALAATGNPDYQADLWPQLFSDVSCIALWISSEKILTRLYSVLHWFHKRLEVNVKNPREKRCFQIIIVFSFGSVDNSNKCTVLWKIAARLITVSTSVNNEMWVKLRLPGGVRRARG